jgi:hypothetical protein
MDEKEAEDTKYILQKMQELNVELVKEGYRGSDIMFAETLYLGMAIEEASDGQFPTESLVETIEDGRKLVRDKKKDPIFMLMRELMEKAKEKQDSELEVTSDKPNDAESYL